MTLSLTTMAVTLAEANDYATSRGIGDWTGADLLKTQAMRRGQDYIAGVYNGRWLVGFDDTTAPDGVKYAICEAATREIKVPFSLTPDVVLGREKVLTRVGNIGWTQLKDDIKANDLRPVLTSIDGMLRGLVTLYPGSFVV